MSSDNSKIKKRALERIPSNEGNSSDDETYLEVIEKAIGKEPKSLKKAKKARNNPLGKRFSDPSCLELPELVDKADDIVRQDPSILTSFYDTDCGRLKLFLTEILGNEVDAWAFADDWFKCVNPLTSSEQSLRKANLLLSWVIRKVWDARLSEPSVSAIPIPPEELIHQQKVDSSS